MVVIAYTTVAFLQLRKMKDAVDAANRSAVATEQANCNAVDTDRPWIGIEIAVKNWTLNENPIAMVAFVNGGRRPAIVTAGAFSRGDFKVLPKDPPYPVLAHNVKSTILILPNLNATNQQTMEQFTTQRMAELETRKNTLFIYAKVEYEDVRTHEKHWTHGCMEYFPGFHNTSNGFVNCASYNDIDPEVQKPCHGKNQYDR